MDRKFKVAIVGATGLVGETLIAVLEERGFPLEKLFALDSDRALGHELSFQDARLRVHEIKGFDFAQADIAFFTAGTEVSLLYAPRALAAGCWVIDNTSAFLDREEVPLVVPEVNPQALDAVQRPGIVVNPNCAAIQLVVALKPLHDAAGIERIDVVTYQSASGAGRAAVEELARQSIHVLSGKGPVELDGPYQQTAFNCIPHIDEFEANGYTREELKVMRQSARILGDPGIRVNATTVRVPVFYGHSEAVHITTRRPLSAAQARERLQSAPGVTVIDEPRVGGYPTAATEAANRDTVYVGRIREDLPPERGLNLWVVADNVRKGAATNCVQIAEALARRPI
ncbi:MAG: aspartate-semialdehyde dehydrogenase [Proteobacteria bacterium]|nr:aspartate-semialdehyde dehydrogenase [Pseudomonadota bacterium]